MYLTIWRHGQAGSAASDRLRELTNRGHDDIVCGAQRFREACEEKGISRPDCILYSEWVRTRQTADILATALGPVRSSTCAVLMPGHGPAQVDSELEQRLAREPAQHLLLVSHQPLVSALVDYWLGDQGKVPPLQPGGLATLKMDVVAAGCASLVFSAQSSSYELTV